MVVIVVTSQASPRTHQSPLIEFKWNKLAMGVLGVGGVQRVWTRWENDEWQSDTVDKQLCHSAGDHRRPLDDGEDLRFLNTHSCLGVFFCSAIVFRLSNDRLPFNWVMHGLRFGATLSGSNWLLTNWIQPTLTVEDAATWPNEVHFH